jgi:hypothetical protein
MSDSDQDAVREVTKALKLADVCSRCQKTIPPGNKSAHPCAGFKNIDKPCFAALKCLTRICDKDGRGELKEQVNRAKNEEPEKYHGIVDSLMTNETMSRAQTVRDKVLKHLTILFSEDSEIRNDRSFLYPKQQYIAWKCLNENLSEEDALTEWKSDTTNEAVHKEKNAKGQLCVEVVRPSTPKIPRYNT